ERAAHGRELLAKFFGRRRRDVGVVRALVLPDFNHREVVCPVACWNTSKRTEPVSLRLSATKVLSAAIHSSFFGGGTSTCVTTTIAPRPFFTAGVPAISMPVWTRSSMALMRYGLILSRNSLVWAAARCAS